MGWRERGEREKERKRDKEREREGGGEGRGKRGGGKKYTQARMNAMFTPHASD